MLTAEPIVQELLRRGVAEYGMPAPAVVAGRVKSPMAASEHSGSQNPDLADWPVWRKLIDRSGSNTDRCLPPDGISCLVRSTAKRSEKPFTAVGRAAPHLRAGPDF